MPLPASFAKAGFGGLATARKSVTLKNGRKLKPVMIGSEGAQNTGKSEFLLSVPGPGIIICYDRNIEAAIDNPNPPASRRDIPNNFAFKTVATPLEGTLEQKGTDTVPGFREYFFACRREYYAALDVPDAVSVMCDGDSDFFELQVLATFGKTKEIFPQTRWGDVYTPKRAMVARAWESGKIVVATNKLKDEYIDLIDPVTGKPVLDEYNKNQPKRVKSGRLERQGFKEHQYLYNIQIRHLHQPATTKVIEKGPRAGTEVTVPGQFGLVILECKVRTELKGHEVWGEKANFRGLMELCYPNVDIRDFGFD